MLYCPRAIRRSYQTEQRQRGALQAKEMDGTSRMKKTRSSVHRRASNIWGQTNAKITDASATYVVTHQLLKTTWPLECSVRTAYNQNVSQVAEREDVNI